MAVMYADAIYSSEFDMLINLTIYKPIWWLRVSENRSRRAVRGLGETVMNPRVVNIN